MRFTSQHIDSILGKKEPAGPKRRVKSAGRAGKSVSFVDEKSESDNPDVPAIDLVPKEEATVKVVCQHFFDFYFSTY